MLYFVLKQEETDPKIKETLMAEYQKQKVNLISFSLSLSLCVNDQRKLSFLLTEIKIKHTKDCVIDIFELYFIYRIPLILSLTQSSTTLL